MDSSNHNIKKYLLHNTKSIKDYILLIRTNLFSFITISVLIIIAAICYAIFSKSIYKSAVTLRISTEKQSVLEQSAIFPEINNLVNDRFISNEMEVIGNYDTRERYAKALIDSFYNSTNRNLFPLLKTEQRKGVIWHKSIEDIVDQLKDIVTVNQKEGMDIIEISAESPSPYEAALIANTCANEYKDLNLEETRKQLTVTRKFLEKQSKEKLQDLNDIEDTLKNFRERGKIVALDEQSAALISQLSQLDSQRDALKIDLLTSNSVLNQYKDEIKKQDPRLADYLESQSSQAYIDVLQKQIAELQMNKDLALSYKNSTIDVSSKVKEYEERIADLKQKLTSKINNIKSDAFATSPDQVKILSQKLIEEEINNHSLNIRFRELQTIINSYESNFDKLPQKSIELAQYERKRESSKELYLLVEQKYQEAMINELSQPGNITIVGAGRVPDKPSKPHRILIIFIGIILGLAAGMGYLLIKDYFDDKVKTPDDIQDRNIDFLTWVPNFNSITNTDLNKNELIINQEQDSILTEAFSAIRTRIDFSIVDNISIKTILVTSATEKEGKTVISVNLAGSYAQSHKRTLLIDCDLRRPRIHSVMKTSKSPGLVNYLFNKAKFEDIIRTSDIKNLYYITAGTHPPNSANVLSSKAMRRFLEEMKELFDVIIIDSAPIVSVIDTEILSKIVDGTIVVVSSNKTEIKLMTEAVNLVKRDKVRFLGTVLNNFKYKNGYGYYYKYYYNYSSNGENKSLNKKGFILKRNEIQLKEDGYSLNDSGYPSNGNKKNRVKKWIS